MKALIKYRPMRDSDRSFVIGSWLDSFRDSHAAGMIAVASFHTVMGPQVEELLERSGSRTLVACNRDDDDQLLGFICFDLETGADPPVVHYVFVKLPYRRGRREFGEGIATGLFRTAGIDPSSRFDYTYKTATVPRLERAIPFASWEPMLARFPKGLGRRRAAARR